MTEVCSKGSNWHSLSIGSDNDLAPNRRIVIIGIDDGLGWWRIYMRHSASRRLDHDDVIKWKHFPRNWPFVRGIHRTPVNSPHTKAGDAEFDVFFDLRLNKQMNTQSWGWWFETLPHPLWRHCNVKWAALNWLRRWFANATGKPLFNCLWQCWYDGMTDIETLDEIWFKYRPAKDVNHVKVLITKCDMLSSKCSCLSWILINFWSSADVT